MTDKSLDQRMEENQRAIEAAKRELARAEAKRARNER